MKKLTPKRKKVKKAKTKRKKATTKAKPQKSALTLKQQRFCKLYVSDTEFFGNGVQSYAEAYSIDLTKKGYNVAQVQAYNQLRNPKILAYLNKLLDDMGLNNIHVDKQLAFLITQNAELGVKMSAIREFNKLRSRIEDKVKVQGEVTVIIKDRAGRSVKNNNEEQKGLV